jgi:hypothetical protein
MKKLNRKTIKQGGFTKEVFSRPEIQEYIKKELVFGFVGSDSRTDADDANVERIFRQAGYTVRQLAEFLICSEGRHLSDKLPDSEDRDALISSYANRNKIEFCVREKKRAGKDAARMEESFPITSLSREDLTHPLIGFTRKKALKVTDEQMQRIADKLADDYCEQLFWSSLQIISETVIGRK